MQAGLNVEHVRALHGDRKRVADRIVAHQLFDRGGAEIAVLDQLILHLEAADRHLRVLAVNAVGLRGQVAELPEPVLIGEHLFAGVAEGPRLCDALGVIERFFRVPADLAVRIQIVALLEVDHGVARSFIEDLVRLVEIAELVEPFLDGLNVRSLVADAAEIDLRVDVEELVIGRPVQLSRDRQIAPALERLERAFGDPAEIIRRLILVHVAEDHQPLLNGGDDLVVEAVLCYGVVPDLKNEGSVIRDGGLDRLVGLLGHDRGNGLVRVCRRNGSRGCRRNGLLCRLRSCRLGGVVFGNDLGVVRVVRNYRGVSSAEHRTDDDGGQQHYGRA